MRWKKKSEKRVYRTVNWRRANEQTFQTEARTTLTNGKLTRVYLLNGRWPLSDPVTLLPDNSGSTTTKITCMCWTGITEIQNHGFENPKENSTYFKNSDILKKIHPITQGLFLYDFVFFNKRNAASEKCRCTKTALSYLK